MSETEEYRHPYQSVIDEYHKNEKCDMCDFGLTEAELSVVKRDSINIFCTKHKNENQKKQTNMKNEETKKEVSPANHLAGVHSGKVETKITEKPKEEVKTENTNANHLASVHTGEVKVEPETEKVHNHYEKGSENSTDTQLGEVPEVLPTELGGMPVITETEENVVVDEKTETTTPETEVKKKDDFSDSSEDKAN